MPLQLEIATVIALALVVKLLGLLLLPRAYELFILLNIVAIVVDVVMRIALLIHGQGLVRLVL